MNLSRAQAQVREFMVAANQDLRTVPGTPIRGVATEALRRRLHNEELDELHEGMLAGNITMVADGLADLLYVLLGTASAYGINIEPIFDEVHRSNMTKFQGGRVDEHGKLIKSPDYSPANIKPLLELQRRNGVPHA